MNLIDGFYLNHEICAFSGNQKAMWLIVFDGKFNYMLFNATGGEEIRQYERGFMPSNNICKTGGSDKQIEFYSNFNNALNNLMRVVINSCFNPTFLKEVFKK